MVESQKIIIGFEGQSYGTIKKIKKKSMCFQTQFLFLSHRNFLIYWPEMQAER